MGSDGLSMPPFQVPGEVMLHNEFRRLPSQDRLFLISLYMYHGKESRFQIEAKESCKYIGKDLTKYRFHQKIKTLVDSGLIKIADWENVKGTARNVRVFEFLYPVTGN